MSAGAGMDIRIWRRGNVIAGVTTKSFSINNEPIDVTTDDDRGVRATLADYTGDGILAANRTLDLSVSGIAKDRDFIVSAIKNENTKAELELEFVTGPLEGEKLVGVFDLSAVSISGERTGAQEFDATLSSDGIWELI